MNQEIRNKLRNVVTQCRKLLEESISQELEGKYGIFAKKDQVTADPNAPMTHLIEEERAARKDILDHFAHIKARGFKPKDALDQLVREIAFTHLNRLCAYKMMEAREVYINGQKFREAVSRGFKSNGFLHYLGMEGHEADERLYSTGQQDVAYRHFLDWLGGLLSEEIGVLFNPNDPANRLYPKQKTLDEVLALLNDGGIKVEEAELREEWTKIWSQDETIGWVYQYFTPKELRDQARKESAAPRNSYELAFRNQFFTPRYVVEFLTDNTLGRIWYEMRNGDTRLKDQCNYMVNRPTEVFLGDGEKPPKESVEREDDVPQEELLKLPVYVPHRRKKDPRELRILDPACGSGHFLLYCFDLLLTIYEEAYSDPDLGPAFNDKPKDEFRRDIPGLILAHNLHGIDIDLRCTQIAALALWLRCQRAYQEMSFKKDRPRITRSNLVCAEPMPGENEMLRDFVSQIEPRLLGQLVEVVFDRMKLAGEAGSLLRIEDGIRDTVAQAKRQWLAGPISIQRSLFDDGTSTPEQQRFDFSGVSDEQFFEHAEGRVVDALRAYAELANDSYRLPRRLFSEDAVRGFAFVDLCHRRFDVLLMNPPFGEPTGATRTLFKVLYPTAADNLAVAFLLRSRQMCTDGGRVGSITDCSWAKKYDYTDFRKLIVNQCDLSLLIDLGWSVMDTANVEANLAVRGQTGDHFLGANLSESNEKEAELLAASVEPSTMRRCAFRTVTWLPNHVFAYDMPANEVASYRRQDRVSNSVMKALAGVKSCKAEADFRTWWEVPETQLGEGCTWEILQNGSPFSPYHYPACFSVRTDGGKWSHLMGFGGARPGESYYRKIGLAYGKRTDDMYAYFMPGGQIFSQEGQALFPISDDLLWASLQLANSSAYSRHANYVAGQHKYHNYLNLICLPTRRLSTVGATAKRLVSELSILDASNETSLGFVGCCAVPEFSLEVAQHERNKHVSDRQSLFEKLRADADSEVASALEIPSESELRPVDYYSAYYGSKYSDRLAAAVTASYAVGCAFGRWVVRTSEEQHAIAQKPVLAVHAGGLPRSHGTGEAQGFDPLIHAGILPDDPEHSDDISHRIRNVLETVWTEAAEIEREMCAMLAVESLQEYFRNPGKGGFWDDHTARYAKSRRKAPIYWLLQSSKKNYALWLYYHRLDKDLLFKALVKYVEPKIRMEDGRLKNLRIEKAKAGDSGKEAKRLAKDVERQEDFISELQEFEDTLRRAANRHLEPDLNDGVVLNIAPLYELVPWKEAKNYWDELLEGKYEWSSIGKQLRQKGLVK